MKIKKLSKRDLALLGFSSSYSEEDDKVISTLESDNSLEKIIKSEREVMGINEDGIDVSELIKSGNWLKWIINKSKNNLERALIFPDAIRTIYGLHSRYISSIEFLVWTGFFTPSEEPPIKVFTPKSMKKYMESNITETDGAVYIQVNGKMSKTRLRDEIWKVFDQIENNLNESIFNSYPYHLKSLADLKFHQKIDKYYKKEKNYRLVAEKISKETGLTYDEDLIRNKHDYFKKKILPKIKKFNKRNK